MMINQQTQQRQYWLLKSEPETYSWSTLVTEGFTHWDGVRNHQAKGNLQRMQVDDWALFYHSVSEKAVVGLCRIARTAYPDPTDETGRWVAVGVEPVQPLPNPVPLATIKSHPLLQTMALVRQGRLSVAPLTAEEFACLLELGGCPMPLQ